MADVEQRAEAEASAKGLSGQARKSYIGGVFNKIRQAHARVVKPGKGKTFMSNLNRRNRQLARARYKEALAPHEQAVADLKRQRKQELEQLSYEKAPKSERTPTPAAPITPKPPKLPAPERQRQRAIADAIKHGAPDFPPGTLAAAQGKPAPTGVRLSVRPYTYHGNAGYLISGSDKLGRRISIFARSKSEAERMRDDIKAGRETMFDSER